MKLFVLLNVCLFIKLVNFAGLDSNTLRSASNDLQQKIIELQVENANTLKTVSELKIQNAKLLTELMEIETKQKEFTEAVLSYWNCSNLVTPIDRMTSSLKMLHDDFQLYKPLIIESLNPFGNKHETIENETEEKTNRCDCIPQSTDNALFDDACSYEKSNGSWTVIQRRMDGSTNFYRPWREYKAGFGNRSAEFFIGLENLHLLTTCGKQELRIDMIFHDNSTVHTMFDLFEVGTEKEFYMLKELGNVKGLIAAAFMFHKSYKFSTFDRDNDIDDKSNCALKHRSGWWFNDCVFCNFNGEYERKDFGISCFTDDRTKENLKFVEMKIRPKKVDLPYRH